MIVKTMYLSYSKVESDGGDASDIVLLLALLAAIAAGIMGIFSGVGLYVFFGLIKSKAIFIGLFTAVFTIVSIIWRWCVLVGKEAKGEIVAGKVVKPVDKKSETLDWAKDVKN